MRRLPPYSPKSAYGQRTENDPALRSIFPFIVVQERAKPHTKAGVIGRGPYSEEWFQELKKHRISVFHAISCTPGFVHAIYFILTPSVGKLQLLFWFLNAVT